MRKELDAKSIGRVFVSLVFLVAGFFIMDLWVPSGVAIPMLYPVVVLLAGWLPDRKHTLLAAAATSLLVLAGLLPSRPDSVRLVLIINHLLALVAIWVTAGLMLLHKQREEKIRHLTGLLPMCSLCKKIRDDQGLWSQVEQYFEEHYADLQFTHGLCPVCSRQLYPGLFPRLSEQHPEVYKEAR
jgi:hypothetical protein